MEGDSELQDLYREVLLDYFRDGARQGRLDPADYRAHGINPVCGDEIELTMSMRAPAAGATGKVEPVVDKIRYAGHGCVISQASSAMMAESLEGATVARANELISAFKDMMLSKKPLEDMPEELDALKALEGVRKYPMRVKCATLAWNTLHQGLAREKGTAEFQEGE